MNYTSDLTLAVRRSLFETLASPGPVGYARTLGGDAAQLEQHRRYANGIVLKFLDAVEQGR